MGNIDLIPKQKTVNVMLHITDIQKHITDFDFNEESEKLECQKGNSTRVAELINQIGNSLDSPNYAGKVLTECGKEILQIVEDLEEQIEILKKE